MSEFSTFFEQLQSDVCSNFSMRIYSQQNDFQFLSRSNIQKPLAKFQTSPVKSKFPNGNVDILSMNSLITQSICDVLSMNKKINDGLKLSVSLLGNGKSIAQKKQQYFKDFFTKSQFEFLNEVRKEYCALQPYKQQLLNYRMAGISNLILKIGINMNKLTMIVMYKPVLPKILSTLTLSLLFLQYLDYLLVRNKKLSEQIVESIYLNQIPKITMIKLTKKRNGKQANLLESSQQNFFKRSDRIIRNLQYIQLYEQQDPDQKQFKPNTQYQYIYSINLKEKLHLKRPYGYQLSHFYEQYLIPIMVDFDPSVVIIFEDFPGNQYIMDPALRSLILSQIINKVTAKIYFFRQIDLMDSTANFKKQLLFREISKKEHSQQKKYEDKIIFQNYFWNNGRDIKVCYDKQVLKFLNKTKQYLIDDLSYVSLALLQKLSIYKLQQKIKTKKLDLQYVQRVQQMQILMLEKQSKKQKLRDIQTQFKIIVNRTENLKRNLKQKQNIITSQTNFIQDFEEFFGLNDKIVNIMNKRNQYSKIFNLKTGKYQILKDNNNCLYTYQNKDQIFVHYLQYFFLIFIFKPKHYSILVKKYPRITVSNIEIQNSTSQQDMLEFTCWVHQQEYPFQQMNNLRNTILVASQRYIYRGFGIKNEDSQPYFSNKIYRFSLNQQLILLPVTNKNVWQICNFTVVPNKYLKSCIQNPNFSISKAQKKQNFQLEKKHSGYGFYDQNSKNVYFMGGYVQAKNEQKISKIICIVDDQKEQNILNMHGKTKKQTFDENLLKVSPDKTFCLFPFIFGISFQIHSKPNQAFILNTNGFYQNLNNSKKLFMSTMKLSKFHPGNGIAYQSRQPKFQNFKYQIKNQFTKQNLNDANTKNKRQQQPQYKRNIDRLRAPQTVQQYQFARQKLIQLIILSCQQVNQYKDCYCVQTQSGSFVIRFRLLKLNEGSQNKARNEKLIQVFNIQKYFKKEVFCEQKIQAQKGFMSKSSTIDEQQWSENSFQLLFY